MERVRGQFNAKIIYYLIILKFPLIQHVHTCITEQPTFSLQSDLFEVKDHKLIVPEDDLYQHNYKIFLNIGW